MRPRWLRAASAAIPVGLTLFLTVAPAGAGGAGSSHGPPGRTPLTGDWLYRPDPADVGLRDGWAGEQSATDWTTVAVPSAWNATDFSLASDVGSVGWYRKDFVEPEGAGGSAVVRFEGTSMSATVFLNGVRIGAHEGLQTPFELPLTGLRPGVNRLVVRIDNRDLPSGGSGPLRKRYFWNFGGLLREVYLRRVESVDIPELLARPDIGCSGCPARVLVRATVTNRSTRPVDVDVRATLDGKASSLGRVEVMPGATAAPSGTLEVQRPELWSPARPRLYDLRVTAAIDGRGVVAESSADVGLRRIAVRRGRIYLNGRAARLYGVGLHEQWPGVGPVLTDAQRAADFRYLRALHVNFIRSQIPLHPAALEAADREGILVWEDIPVGYLDAADLAAPRVDERAVAYLREVVARDQNHPSVVVWGVGNENEQRSDPPDPALRRYLSRMTREAHVLDPTRLVGTETALLGQRAFGGYRHLDVIGLNTFPVNGLYERADTPANRRRLRALIEQQHERYPRQALVITEAGAETIRRGHGRGGEAEQANLLRWQLSEFARSPVLSGVTVWILRDFLVRPDWLGTGQPFDTKGLLTWHNRRRGAFGVVARLYRSALRRGAGLTQGR